MTTQVIQTHDKEAKDKLVMALVDSGYIVRVGRAKYEHSTDIEYSVEFWK